LLPAENMLIFTLPKPLRRKIQRVRDSLTRLSDMRSGAAMYEMSQKIANYDYKDHDRTEKLALAQCCAATGWDARGWYRQETTEYAINWERLQLEFFMIEMRKVVLELFNEALDRVRRNVPYKGHVALVNPPNETTLAAARYDLEHGRDSFVNIMKRLR
jgi:hypothetical protein